MKTAYRILSLSLLLAFAGGAFAQIADGDFETGGTWGFSAPGTWTIGIQAGGNPGMHGYIHSPWGNSGGLGCFEQSFYCGVEDPAGQSSCSISLDFYLHIIDASAGTARVVVSIDGINEYVSPAGEDWIDWTRITLDVSCGYHNIALCLEVDPGNNGWEAGFDNVTADCDAGTPAESGNWSTFKSLY